MWWLPRLDLYTNADAMFYSLEKANFGKKNLVLRVEKFLLLVLARNIIWQSYLQHLIIRVLLHY